MSSSSPAVQIVEPKYCELCGALWLRPAGAEPYCPRCVQRAGLPQSTAPRERGDA